jgi:hypothetical protein
MRAPKISHEKGWPVMRTIYLRATLMGALAGFVLASDTTTHAASSGVLNALEVQQLVASPEPADHVQLGAHFAALAERYAAEAKWHKAVSRAFNANPTRQATTQASAHFTRLADLNSQLARTLLELAAHHEALASGIVSAVPPGAAHFEGGAGALAPTKEELIGIAAKARTPADHRGIEEYFLTLSKRYTAAANEHVAMAHGYRGTRIAPAAAHCDRLISLSRDAAKEANRVATLQRQLANIAR